MKLSEIKITISLAEFFASLNKTGHAVIDNARAKQVMDHDNWQEEVVLNPILQLGEEAPSETCLYTIWKKSEWIINCAGLDERRRAESEAKNFENEVLKAKHQEFIAKKESSLKLLTSKGYSIYDAQQIIKYALAPRKVKEQILDEDTFEFSEKISENPIDLKWREVLGFDNI